MKYIKKIKELISESTDVSYHDENVIQNCEDILVDLKDRYFNITIESNTHSIMVVINKHHEFLKVEVEEDVLRLIEYLKSEGLDIYPHWGFYSNVSPYMEIRLRFREFYKLNH